MTREQAGWPPIARWGWFFRALRCALALTLLSNAALAQSAAPRLEARFSWEAQGRALVASFSFRHLIDDQIQRKLSRGLPTKILLTALVRRADNEQPVSSTYQSCTITWHVWEEMYRVEVSRPNLPIPTKHWTPTMNGVLRRCAEAEQLLVADSAQVSRTYPVYLDATLRINPISEELLGKLKHWVSRPSAATTISPGGALFSTFTGLFMQRLGDAERTFQFKSQPSSAP